MNSFFPSFFVLPFLLQKNTHFAKVLRDANINFNPQGFNTNVKTDGSVWLANFGLNAENFNFDLYALLGFTLGSLLLTLPLLSMSHGRMGGDSCTCSTERNSERNNENRSEDMSGGDTSGSSSSEPPRRTRLSSSNISRPLLGGGGGSSGAGHNGDDDDVTTRATDIDYGTEEQDEEEHHVLTFTDIKCVLPGGRCILQNVRGSVDTNRVSFTKFQYLLFSFIPSLSLTNVL